MNDDRQSPSRRQSPPYIGCCETGGRRDVYFRRFSALEYQQSFFSPPKPRALSQLRHRAPEGFSFIVRAWQLITHEPSFPGYRRLPSPLAFPADQYGHFQPTPAVQQAALATIETAEALQARAILFETPASFSPSLLSRKHISRFFETLAREGLVCIWHPRGLWSRTEVDALCTDLDLVPCLDPLHEASPLSRSKSYFKLEGMGVSSRISDSHLHHLAALGQACEESYFLFNTVNMVRDASRLLAVLSSLADEGLD